MPAVTTRENLQHALNDADFPAGKDDLVDRAVANGADDETVRALRALPPVEYQSFAEVRASVSLRAEQDVVPAGEHAKARRTHTKPGLAESSKDLPPGPIPEELGTNPER